jgi:hypothetical protein
MVPVAVRLTSGTGANKNSTGGGVCHYRGRDGETREQRGNDHGQSEDGLHKTTTIAPNHPHRRQNGRNGTEVDAKPGPGPAGAALVAVFGRRVVRGQSSAKIAASTLPV